MKKRRRPTPVVMMPACWGTTKEAAVNLGLHERQCLDALLAGTATKENYRTLEATCEAAIHACDAATAPEYGLDADGLRQLRERLVHCARALLGVRDRAAQMGRYGCSGPQRQDLMELCDRLHDMRTQMPRRVLLAGLERVLSGADLVIDN